MKNGKLIDQVTVATGDSKGIGAVSPNIHPWDVSANRTTSYRSWRFSRPRTPLGLPAKS